MKKFIWAPLLVALVALPASAETAEDLDKWFRDGYAALYVENSWDHADEFAQYFADVMVTRTENGVSQSDVDGFVVDSLEVWRSEGWLGTDVESLDTKLLNATTAVFDVEWHDRNDDGSTENSCGWYFADKIDGKWLLSQYIAMSCAGDQEAIGSAIGNANRAEANSDRDGARKPDQVLEFVGLEEGDVVLDYGAGGGYWTELFSGVVGDGGTVYAHQRAGERYENGKEALTAQFSPFGNIELMPLDRGAVLPLADGSVDTILVSYLYHHMHYADGSGESFPDSSTALFGEFRRVLKPGGSVIIIEHAAIEGSGRAESGGWHRTPPEMAKADMASIGLEFAGDAPEIFYNPDDDQKHFWGQSGLRGNTTTFVHKYSK